MSARRPHPAAQPDRNRRIRELRQTDQLSYGRLSALFGPSRQRIYEIVNGRKREK